MNPKLDPNPDPLVRGMDLRILIHTKISWICNAGRELPGPIVWYVKKRQGILHNWLGGVGRGRGGEVTASQ